MIPGETIRLSWAWTGHDGKELDLTVEHVVTEEDIMEWRDYKDGTDEIYRLTPVEWLENRYFDHYREEAAQKWQELQS